MSYFDYEKISDHLPADGEAIIVFRKEGELGVRACPFLPEDLSQDHDSMGRLLIANERLRLASGPFLVLALLTGLLCCGAIALSGRGWLYWWLYVMVFVALLSLQALLAGARQRRAFQPHGLEALELARLRHKLSAPALLAVIKQINELQLLAGAYQQHLANAPESEPHHVFRLK